MRASFPCLLVHAPVFPVCPSFSSIEHMARYKQKIPVLTEDGGVEWSWKRNLSNGQSAGLPVQLLRTDGTSTRSRLCLPTYSTSVAGGRSALQHEVEFVQFNDLQNFHAVHFVGTQSDVPVLRLN